MKCFVLEKDELFNSAKSQKKEISKELEKEIQEICLNRQVRDLRQKNVGSLYGYSEDYESYKYYEALIEENFVIKEGKIIGYYSKHFDETCYVPFTGKEVKVRVCDYDYSDYSGGSNKVNRGHITIVCRPDNDTNPYHDEARFHSQEEYDDYIKWRD